MNRKRMKKLPGLEMYLEEDGPRESLLSRGLSLRRSEIIKICYEQGWLSSTIRDRLLEQLEVEAEADKNSRSIKILQSTLRIPSSRRQK